MSVSELASLGGQARAAKLSERRRREIAKAGGRASAASRAKCEHPATERRFSVKTGKRLPGGYCVTCRRKVE